MHALRPKRDGTFFGDRLLGISRSTVGPLTLLEAALRGAPLPVVELDPFSAVVRIDAVIVEPQGEVPLRMVDFDEPVVADLLHEVEKLLGAGSLDPILAF